MASAPEVEMLRRQLDELTAQMIEIRQQSSSTAMNAALTGPTEALRKMGQSVSESRKARAVRTWQSLRRLGFLVQRTRGYFRSCLSSLAENSETITNSGDGNSHHTKSSLQPCCAISRCSHRKEHGKS